MPYRKPSQEEADLIKETGANPQDYLVDDTSGEAVPAKELDTWSGAAAEFGKGAVRSIRDTVAGAVKFPGTIADAIRNGERATGDVQLTDSPKSLFTQAGEAIGRTGESLLAADPNLDKLTTKRIASKVGGALGMAAGLAGPGIAAKGASVAAETLPLAAATLSGAQRVSERAEAQGSTSRDAASRGVGYLPVSFLENLAFAKMGLAAHGPHAAAFMGRRLAGSTVAKEAGMGAVGSGVDELTQQGISGENVDLAQAGEAAALGSLAQGTVAKVAGAGRQTTDESAADLAAKMAADPEIKAQEQQKIIADTALEARIAARLDAQGRGEKYDTIQPTPVDVVFQEAQRRKIPMDEDMLRSLEEIYGGNAANEKKVFEAARLLLDRGRVTRPNKTQPTPEMVEAQQKELAKIDSQMDSVAKRRDVILEQQTERAKEAMKNPPAADAGDVWLQMAQERAATETGELRMLEQQYAQLLEQRKLLTQEGNATPAGGPQPLEVGSMQNRVLTAQQSDAQITGRAIGQEPMAQSPAMGGLEGQPIRPGIELPASLPSEQVATAPQEPFSTRPSAGEFAAAEALAAAKARKIAESQRQPVAIGGREATRPRERGPRGQQERDLIEDALAELSGSEQRPPLQSGQPPRPKEVRDYMRGETLPGMEGEQGLPFSGEKTTETYGTLIPPSIIEAFRKRGLRTADPIRLMHEVTQHHMSRLAKRGPVGAYVASKLNHLYINRDQIRNRKQAEFDAIQKVHGKTLEDPRYLAWKSQAHSARTADLNLLPAELRPGAAAMEDFIKSFHKEQNERGIAVWERTPDGKYVARPAESVEGYGIYDLNPEVYRAMEEGGKDWDRFEKDWKENWVAHKGSEAGSEQALQAFRGAFARARFSGGEPLFSAVRNQIGVPLPESWRSNNLVDSMNHYIDSWAKDVAWAQDAQGDPLMRRALGITHDAAGVNQVEADAAYRPSKAEWELMIDRGKRVDADWVRNLRPNMPLDQPISGRDPLGANLYASYTQTPLTSSKGGRVFNTLNQLAATAMMQHMTKLRNIAQSGITVLDYTLGREAPVVMKALVDSVAHPVAAITRGQEAGAIPMDIVQHEFSDALSGGMYKALREFRKWTGLNAMDSYAKSVAYNVAEAAVAAQVRRLGAEAPLLREFANTDLLSKGGSLEAAVKEAAATIANHVDPQFDIRSLPGGMIPQNRGLTGNLFRLMTWSVGRFNHWYTDAYLPAVTGGDKTRLLSSLFVGAIGAAATQELIAWLQNKMPRDLSLGEWMRLDSEQQQKEFAPMLFGYLQAQGNMGILGDIAYMGARVANKRPITQDYTRPMIPALLVGTDMTGMLWDFHRYATDEKGGYQNLDMTDLMKLGVELAKVNQTVRATLGRGDDWLPERLKTEADDAKLKREQKVFEETIGRSALTGDLKSPLSLVGQASGFMPNPFSLNKEFNAREGEDFVKLLPVAGQAAARGITFRTDAGRLAPAFYQDVANRRGASVADQVIQQTEQKENERRVKKPIARSLNRLARSWSED